jgi:hypothetical protein
MMAFYRFPRILSKTPQWGTMEGPSLARGNKDPHDLDKVCADDKKKCLLFIHTDRQTYKTSSLQYKPQDRGIRRPTGRKEGGAQKNRAVCWARMRLEMIVSDDQAKIIGSDSLCLTGCWGNISDIYQFKRIVGINR